MMQGLAEYLVDVGYSADMQVRQTVKDELDYEKE